MSVYVDDMKAKFGQMIMCHMVADNLEELHAMADKIGVQRRWFQDHPIHPHYDIALSKRFLAVRAGALERTMFEIARWGMTRLKAKRYGKTAYFKELDRAFRKAGYKVAFAQGPVTPQKVRSVK